MNYFYLAMVLVIWAMMLTVSVHVRNSTVLSRAERRFFTIFF